MPITPELEVLEKFFKSDNFGRIKERHRAKRLLTYLAEYCGASHYAKRTERALDALPFMGEKHTPIPMMLRRLQEALDEFFESDEGKLLPQRLWIVRGIDVATNDPRHNGIECVPNHAAERLTRMFWAPHIDAPAPRVRPENTHIAYGLPMFMRSEAHDRFIRDIAANSPSTVEAGLQECYPYVTLGDIMTTVELTAWLKARGVPVSSHHYYANSGHSALLEHCESEKDNVIAIGSQRVNGVLDHYQAGTDVHFRLGLNSVSEVDPKGTVLKEDAFVEERQQRSSTVPVVITRTKGRRAGALTMIAANHGRAVERVASILRTEVLLEDLFKHPDLTRWSARVPTSFQIVLKVTVEDDELFAGSHELLDTWPRQAKGA